MSFDVKFGDALSSTFSVSIPLEQGNVFRPNLEIQFTKRAEKSQSLWNRVMSFDKSF